MFDLSWGCPVVVRQALIETLGDFEQSYRPLNSMGYTPHLGNPKLIEQLKDLAKRQSGHRPKHLMVTCGATGAINAALYALKDHRIDFVFTNKRYYPIYPSIIYMADMAMINLIGSNRSISLIDSPSAPEGLIHPFDSVDVWDAAYASKTYTKGFSHVPKKYRIMCGSLSKTLGLSGLRLGWASTDDNDLAKSMANYVTASYIGLSSASMDIAGEVLRSLDQEAFETRSEGYLDSNREEAQKLLTKFGQGSVPERGMFAILELGKAERKALEKANIMWQPGSTWGEDDSWARLSLGQTREVVRSAVKAALK